jgi:cytochrome c556
MDDSTKRLEDYRARLKAAEVAADALRNLLRRPPDNAAMDAELKQASHNCATCHKKYRNE